MIIQLIVNFLLGIVACAYPDITYTTDEGHQYTISYNDEGYPVRVQPFFPASLGTPNTACRQLYVHIIAKKSVEYQRQWPVKAFGISRVTRHHPNWQSGPRVGMDFGCLMATTILERLAGLPNYPWFMSCDYDLDYRLLKIFGQELFPNNESACVLSKEEAEFRGKIERLKIKKKQEDYVYAELGYLHESRAGGGSSAGGSSSSRP